MASSSLVVKRQPPRRTAATVLVGEVAHVTPKNGFSMARLEISRPCCRSSLRSRVAPPASAASIMSASQKESMSRWLRSAALMMRLASICVVVKTAKRRSASRASGPLSGVESLRVAVTRNSCKTCVLRSRLLSVLWDAKSSRARRGAASRARHGRRGRQGRSCRKRRGSSPVQLVSRPARALVLGFCPLGEL
jgi:hypothetical protein